jgi:hypothetical protein
MVDEPKPEAALTQEQVKQINAETRRRVDQAKAGFLSDVRKLNSGR